MRVLYFYCHPLPESFHAAIREEAIAGLKAAGHEVDLCDLSKEGFDPVLSEEGRRHYHDESVNQIGLESHVARLQAAEGLVVQFPTWCFGMPAMLKGYSDRLIMPGVAFDLSNPAKVQSLLRFRRIAGIATYGRPRYMALYMGGPRRKIVKRYLGWYAARGAKVDYHALYHLNVASKARRKGFIADVGAAMKRF